LFCVTGSEGLDAESLAVVSEFHKLYYDAAEDSGTWNNTYWVGVPTLKCPLDMWIYQEILVRIRPDKIIECGTAQGGSALFLAHICDIIDQGEVITIDIDDIKGRPEHERIEYLFGSSISEEILHMVSNRIQGEDVVMVILDSDHNRDHVLKEMELYSPLVTRGSYLVVEDTNINGNPVLADFGPGPAEAVREFLQHHNEFEVDRNMEKFYMTFSPGGYLRRVR